MSCPEKTLHWGMINTGIALQDSRGTLEDPGAILRPFLYQYATIPLLPIASVCRGDQFYQRRRKKIFPFQ
jgi:hypothetical protein